LPFSITNNSNDKFFHMNPSIMAENIPSDRFSQVRKPNLPKYTYAFSACPSTLHDAKKKRL